MRYFGVILIVILCSCKQKNKPCEIPYLKEFATQYTYDEWGTFKRKNPENFCSKVINAYQCDSSETMIYLNLIMLKMYLSHLKSAEMGHIVAPFWDAKTKSPVLINELSERNCLYYYISKEAPEENIEGVYSGMGHYNVENDTTQLKNEALRIAFFEVKAYLRHLDSLLTYHPEQLK